MAQLQHMDARLDTLSTKLYPSPPHPVASDSDAEDDDGDDGDDDDTSDGDDDDASDDGDASSIDEMST